MEKLVNTRARELYYLKLANLVGAISNTFWFLAPYMVSSWLLSVGCCHLIAGGSQVTYVNYQVSNVVFDILISMPDLDRLKSKDSGGNTNHYNLHYT